MADHQRGAEFDLLSTSAVEEPWKEEDLDLPSGYRFLPDDYELIIFYLSNKILHRPVPVDVIKVLDLYASDPDKLPISKVEFESDTETKAHYFMETSDAHGRDVVTTENGEWVQIDEEEAIHHGNTIVGYKKVRHFHWKLSSSPEVCKTQWIINELRLNAGVIPDNVLLNNNTRKEVDRWIVCRLTRKGIMESQDLNQEDAEQELFPPEH